MGESVGLRILIAGLGALLGFAVSGEDDALTSRNVICGNEFVHAELVKILKPLEK